MESHRQGRRLVTAPRARQRGITLIGLLILAVLVGIVGLAGMKLVPMYINDMKLAKALDGIPEEHSVAAWKIGTSHTHGKSNISREKGLLLRPVKADGPR